MRGGLRALASAGLRGCSRLPGTVRVMIMIGSPLCRGAAAARRRHPVEVAETKEQQAVGMLRLERLVLGDHRLVLWPGPLTRHCV
jgi:hypothetical protein